MLIQLPRESGREPNGQNASECNSFEAALRRDLATAPVLSYDSTLGGWSKRAIDVVVAVLTAPIWAPLVVILAAWSKQRHPAPVFEKHERVGYGGRSFTFYTMRLKPPSAVIERLHPEANEAGPSEWDALKQAADGSVTKWARALERLPQLLSVLKGDMALVGPRPLTHDRLAALRSGRRYYLSARPGVVGISGVADAGDENASQYKIYAMAWSHETDALILWDAVRTLLAEGELWKPTRRVLKAAKRGERAAAAE